MSGDTSQIEGGGGEPSADLLVERLLRVIDEGRRTATYKLALLAGLIDAVALTSGADTIPTRLIAERVLALYYPQVRTYVANDGIVRELRQISMKSSPVLRAVLRLRVAGDAAGCRTLEMARVRIAGRPRGGAGGGRSHRRALSDSVAASRRSAGHAVSL